MVLQMVNQFSILRDTFNEKGSTGQHLLYKVLPRFELELPVSKKFSVLTVTLRDQYMGDGVRTRAEQNTPVELKSNSLTNSDTPTLSLLQNAVDSI